MLDAIHEVERLLMLLDEQIDSGETRSEVVLAKLKYDLDRRHAMLVAMLVSENEEHAK